MFKVKDGVNLKELCRGWEETETEYVRKDELFDEEIAVNKESRRIFHYGFNGLLCGWVEAGYLERVE